MSADGEDKIITQLFLRILLVGGVLVVVYYALALFGVEGIGQTTDIGGGVMLVFGYLTGGIGLLGSLVSFVSNLIRQRARSR